MFEGNFENYQKQEIQDKKIANLEAVFNSWKDFILEDNENFEDSDLEKNIAEKRSKFEKLEESAKLNGEEKQKLCQEIMQIFLNKFDNKRGSFNELENYYLFWYLNQFIFKDINAFEFIKFHNKISHLSAKHSHCTSYTQVLDMYIIKEPENFLIIWRNLSKKIQRNRLKRRR